jgi:hypothetical protein
MEKDGIECNCIRSREVGGGEFDWNDACIFIQTFESSGGTEHFISVEHKTKKILYGFVRLRFNGDDPKRLLKDLEGCALIRELHVYGNLVPVKRETELDNNNADQAQHYGIGKTLLRVAEKMAVDAGWEKMAVVSGVGVRDYYRKLGYVIVKPYNYGIKNLTNVKMCPQDLLHDLPSHQVCPMVFRKRKEVPYPNFDEIIEKGIMATKQQLYNDKDQSVPKQQLSSENNQLTQKNSFTLLFAVLMLYFVQHSKNIFFLFLCVIFFLYFVFW